MKDRFSSEKEIKQKLLQKSKILNFKKMHKCRLAVARSIRKKVDRQTDLIAEDEEQKENRLYFNEN